MFLPTHTGSCCFFLFLIGCSCSTAFIANRARHLGRVASPRPKTVDPMLVASRPGDQIVKMLLCVASPLIAVAAGTTRFNPLRCNLPRFASCVAGAAVHAPYAFLVPETASPSPVVGVVAVVDKPHPLSWYPFFLPGMMLWRWPRAQGSATPSHRWAQKRSVLPPTPQAAASQPRGSPRPVYEALSI